MRTNLFRNGERRLCCSGAIDERVDVVDDADGQRWDGQAKLTDEPVG